MSSAAVWQEARKPSSPSNRKNTGCRRSSVSTSEDGDLETTSFNNIPCSSYFDEILLVDNRNHDWRVANGEYVLGEDIKLQVLESRVNGVLEGLQEKLGVRIKGTGFGFDQQNRIKDKRLFALVEDSIKERLDDDALTLAPSSWRLRERMKTVSVALVICLNVGTDPPDVVKTDPCARLECWVDPNTYAAPRALELVARNLQMQFELWQPRARYKYILDPYVEQVKKLCTSLRRNAKEERVLFHFNGHGVPRPTSNGEIWVFNVDYTQYIPLSVYDLKNWVGSPAIYTFDCSGAGLLLNHFIRDTNDDDASTNVNASTSSDQTKRPGRASLYGKRASDTNECIVLLACGADEILPSSPNFPADIFTSCLTTPIKIALRWFVMCNSTSMDGLGITIDMVDLVPGKLGDRKTPLGELNWIFTAITDTIAWTILPRHLFRKLFRQDILVASLFRNFLLAERLLKSVNCNPLSYPSLPPTWQHHLWQAWDMAVENCLIQLPNLVPSLSRSTPATPPPNSASSKTTSAQMNKAEDKEETKKSSASSKSSETTEYVYRQSEFFANQLTAFQVWLTYGENVEKRRVPEQLPIVLQVLLSSFHRQRALDLLARFLNLGSWAVSLALSVGIFPYVNKLLMSPDDKIRPVLIHIWSKLLALDTSCQSDLVKEMNTHYQSSSFKGGNSSSSRALNEGGHLYFVNQIRWLRIPSSAVLVKDTAKQLDTAVTIGHSVRAAFVLSVIANGHHNGQQLCLQNDIVGVLKMHLLVSCNESYCKELNDTICSLKQWICYTLAKLCERNPNARRKAYQAEVYDDLFALLVHPSTDVVQAAILALGAMIGSHYELKKSNQQQQQQQQQQKMYKQRSGRNTKQQHIGSSANSNPDNRLLQESEVVAKKHDCVIATKLVQTISHGSPIVRRELVFALARLVVDPRHASSIQLTALELQSINSSADENDNIYSQLMSKLGKKIGENAETYLSAWLAMKQLDAADAFPGVSRTAAFVSTFVKEGVLQRIEAIRSHAGINSMNTGTDSGDDNASVKDTSTGMRGIMKPVVVEDVSNQPDVDDILKGMGLISTLYTRRCKDFAQPVPMCRNNASWIPLDSSTVELDPLSVDGQCALKWRRRNITVQQSAHTLLTEGAKWAGVSSATVGPTPSREEPSINHILAAARNKVPVPDKKIQKRLEKLALKNRGKKDKVVFISSNESEAARRRVGLVRFGENELPKMEQHAIFEHGQDMCSQVLFHPYEPALVVAGQFDDITVWKYPEEHVRGAGSATGNVYGESLINQFSNSGPRRFGASVLPPRRNYAYDNRSMSSSRSITPVNTPPRTPTNKDMASVVPSPNKSTVARSATEVSIGSKSSSPVSSSTPRLNGRITSMLWMNESTEPLLMVGSDDGKVRVWRDVLFRREEGKVNGARLVTAWTAMSELKAGSAGPGLLLNFQQRCGQLICGGKTSNLSFWDLETEREIGRMDTGSKSYTTAIASYGQVGVGTGMGGHGVNPEIDFGHQASHAGGDGDIFIVGSGDGEMRLFDKRIRCGGHLAANVAVCQKHRSWVVNIQVPPAQGGRVVLSGSVSGEIKFWDIRRLYQGSTLFGQQLENFYRNRRASADGEDYRNADAENPRPRPRLLQPFDTFDVHRSPMTALAHHSYAPLFATGSHHQFIHIFNNQGETLSSIRYHDGFFKQRIGPVSTLSFHPYKLMLAAGTIDTLVSVYSAA